MLLMKRVLVLCTGNSCRSQMAEGYLRLFGGGGWEVFSAGVEAHGLNPRAIAAMEEDGIDISGHRSKTIDEVMDLDFDHVVTVCDNAKERCPYFPSRATKHHRDFPDPAKATGTDVEIMNAFHRTRIMIKDFCEHFVRTMA